MNWVIIVLVLLSIVGSMMWMMPSPRQRQQAKLRQAAISSGFRVQLVKVKAPRAIGEAEAEERSMLAYRLPRHNFDKADRARHVPWQIFRLNSHANTGLPEGWCWGKGEKQVDQFLSAIIVLIEELPASVFAIDSSAGDLSVYWQESGNEKTVEEIKTAMSKLLELKV